MNVCMVGHGPSLLGAGLGKEIDDHDFVVRLKRCEKTLEFPHDYGTKFDAVSGSWTIREALWRLPAKQVWVHIDSRHEHITDEQIAKVAKTAYINRKVCDRWNQRYREMRNKKWKIHQQMARSATSDRNLGHNHLSAGLLAIVYACELLKPKSITLAGFDSVMSGVFTWSVTRGVFWDHYPDHRWDIENLLLDEIDRHYRVGFDKLVPNDALAGT